MSSPQRPEPDPHADLSGNWSAVPDQRWGSVTDSPIPAAPPPEYPAPHATQSFTPSTPGLAGGQAEYRSAFGDRTTLATSGPTRTTRRKAPRGLVASIVAAIVLVILIIVALINRFNPNSLLGSKDATVAKRAAVNYLTAISEGRAADAVAMLAGSSDDRSLLTAEVLKDSLSRAPITDIAAGEIKDEGSSTFNVTVTYQIGGQSTSDKLYVAVDKGQATLYSATAALGLSDMQGLVVTVNGTPAASKRPQLFPGSYRVVLDSAYLTFTDQPVLVPNSKSSLYRYDLGLKVSDAGVAMFREKVIAQAQACLASTAIDPGCGAALPAVLDNGEQLRDGTISRTQGAEARAQMQDVTPKPGEHLITVITASGATMGKLSIIADCNQGGTWQRCELQGHGNGMYFGDPSINLNDPNLTVQWD